MDGRLTVDGAVGLDGREVRVFERAASCTDDEPAGGDVQGMPLFDRLPRVVRDALQDTVRKWTAQAAWDALMQGVPSYDLATYIRKMDADKAREEDVYGRT